MIVAMMKNAKESLFRIFIELVSNEKEENSKKTANN